MTVEYAFPNLPNSSLTSPPSPGTVALSNYSSDMFNRSNGEYKDDRSNEDDEDDRSNGDDDDRSNGEDEDDRSNGEDEDDRSTSSADDGDHRRRFEELFFGNNRHVPKIKSFQMTHCEWNYVVYVVLHWTGGDPRRRLSQSQFRKKHKPGYRWSNLYDVQSEDGTEFCSDGFKLMRRPDENQPELLVLSNPIPFCFRPHGVPNCRWKSKDNFLDLKKTETKRKTQSTPKRLVGGVYSMRLDLNFSTELFTAENLTSP
jgi:hypothetical protein